MPSPLAHMAMGYVIHKIYRQKAVSETSLQGLWARLGWVIVPLAVSLIPDSDSVLGLAAGDFGRFHNNATHSLIVGLVVSLLSLWVVLLWDRNRDHRI